MKLMIQLKDETKTNLLNMKSLLVEYCDQFNDDESADRDQIVYLISIVDFILQGKIKLNQETYEMILNELIVTSAEHKNNLFMRILSECFKLPKEFLS